MASRRRRGATLNVLALLLLTIQYGWSFLPPQISSVASTPKSPSAIITMCPGAGKDDDPTKVWYSGLADTVQNLLTNSPLNEGKKALVRALAGDYDQEATRAKLDGLIADNPVLMLSFLE